MDTILELWKRRQCPIEDGFFYLDGTYRPIIFRENEISIAESQSALDLSGHSTDCYPNCYLTADGLEILAGSGSWEGEGFIALQRGTAESLVWILHHSKAESFVEVALNDGVLFAVSREYPIRFDWQIPLDRPEETQVLKTNENR